MLPGTSQSSTHNLSPDVLPSELLSSFVLRADQIVRKTNTIHASRLLPRRARKNDKSSRLEVSVCRSTELSEAQIWAICSAHFDLHAPTPAVGRGVGPAAAVLAVTLSIDADGRPYPEHANIVGWHDRVDIPDSELKHFWIDQAQKMAPRFSYMPRP